MPPEELAKYVPGVIKAATIGGKLEMLPRAQFDVSALYYLKSNYTDDAKKKAFKDKYGYDLAPPTTWKQVSDQAIFFASPPNFYGTEFAGKEEAINGRFYEMVVAEGGSYLDAAGKPAFNSDAGVRALDWFVNLYKAKAVPAGHDQLSLGRSRPGLRLGHRRARSRLAWLGDVLQRSEVLQGRRQRRRHRAAGRLVRQAHRLVRHAWLLGDRGLRAQGRRGLAGLVADQ